MNDAEFQPGVIRDPRLAAYAASPLPAWLWTADGRRILWANPAGARVFGAASAAALAERTFGPADRHRRQIARLAGRLIANGAIRLERLQGFGAAPGGLATCGCSRFDFPNGSHGVLIAAGNIALIAPRPAQAHALPGNEMRPDIPAAPASQPSAPVKPVMEEPVALQPPPDYEQPAQSGEAPAEFALFDAFAEPAAAEEPAVTEEPPAAETTFRAPFSSLEAFGLEAFGLEAFSGQHARRLPLRFTWQMDPEGRFSLGTDEFTGLMGPRTTAVFGRPWREIAETFGFDPTGRMMQAFATGATWNGITLNWPVDGGDTLPVELSGLPIFDGARNFIGYRGFGVCRDFDRLARLAALRLAELSGEVAAPQETPQESPAAPSPDPTGVASPSSDQLPEPIAAETSHQRDLETPVEPPKESLEENQQSLEESVEESAQESAKESAKESDKDAVTETATELPADPLQNVVPFRVPGEARPQSLTPVENSAFDELARQLSARLDTENGNELDATGETIFEPLAASPAREAAHAPPEWLAQPEPPARGETARDKALLDLLPVGILIYRLDRLLYANPAFLTQMGYPTLHALEDAGGLDALYVEPGASNASSTSDTGRPVTISASLPGDADAQSSAADARLYTISWDGDSALALIFSGTRHEGAAIAAAIARAEPASAPDVFEPEPDTSEPPDVGHANAEDLAAILDTTAEGILMFDAEGNINAANRSAEALFGHDGDELARRNLADLFALESQHGVFEYLAGIKASGVASLLDHGREVLGRESRGGIIPLSMTMGRTRPDGPNFFAVFRDLSHARKTESELREARRLAERATNAKADVLARISHEVRTPLNAIIGFSEVMIGERFGALGNERYLEYMKDIRASGERVVAIINDLLDLSRIETGKLDLAFTNQNLNELVESCVAVLQPQANRERIIIRTSLAHTLPSVVADARALRQITLNLIGNSIHLANAGGQVIVSTALSDFGEVMLRVRDTGHGLNDNEVAAALEPFRTRAPSDQAESSSFSLSLTKALVEANRARFQIKTGGRSGTLIEIVFPHAIARA
ncbi:PAS domain-containing protein [Bradyrhizobium sp. CSA112]|uniref:PAS domain-containing sensor histidine kinase n=1 Tax=Bradyrhizobium sp. CSA112 TaxID=2699170 RepID=UPI0023B10645|nr:PAS domain-containing protein [Bradyrhizobium sp. CSA112]MDE5453310.1 PAS domain-containing protein [Bradyrhizobium sp. CSA112]